MRLHRFYVNEPLGGEIVAIKDKDVQAQWRNVFRFNVGSQVILFNGDGKEYRAAIATLSYYDTRVSILEVTENPMTPKRNVRLYSSLIKKDKLEWVFEKGTELGVLHFHPILSERCEKKNARLDRAEKIISEAVEQSGRPILPQLHPIVSLEEALSALSVPAVAFHALGEPFSEARFTREAAVFIGPEGGWSDRELQLFKTKNIPLLSLGAATLRAETASIAAAALLLL